MTDDLNSIPGVTASAMVTTDGGGQAGAGITGVPMSSQLAAIMASEVRIGAAVELYSRRQVAAFAARQAASDRAWQDYQRAMLAADTAYEAAMAGAAAEYSRAVDRNA